MKILFTQDFQGVETGGIFYQRGQIVELPDSLAARLVIDKRAEMIAAKVEPVRVDSESVVVEAEASQEYPRKRGRK